MYAIIEGDPIEGFDFYGPFAEWEDAESYSENLLGVNWIVDLNL